MSLLNYPYRIRVNDYSGNTDDFKYYEWILSNIGYGGSKKRGVSFIIDKMEKQGFVFDKSNELWTCKAEERLNRVSWKFYFKEKEHLFFFKLCWAGVEF